jgi:uncharacterized protein YecE (DUF72 family)
MTRTVVGTASWTDKTLIASKRFYPPGCSSAEDRLRYYATQFPMVEIDSSYYGMPTATNSRLWVERTPPAFIFNIKAFRLFTGHQTPLIALPQDIAAALGPTPKRNVYYKDVPPELLDEMWNRYREAIEPLQSSGKLKAVHFQYAPWVAFHPKNREHIEECQRRLAGYQLAVEFRNKSWFAGKHHDMTLAFECERGLVNVIVDEPQGSANSIPSVWEVTVPALSIVRLHGRNHEAWDVKGVAASERFNYDYTDAELEDFGRKISGLPAELSQVVFNNNYEDQGQRNARTLTKILDNMR